MLKDIKNIPVDTRPHECVFDENVDFLVDGFFDACIAKVMLSTMMIVLLV